MLHQRRVAGGAVGTCSQAHRLTAPRCVPTPVSRSPATIRNASTHRSCAALCHTSTLHNQQRPSYSPARGRVHPVQAVAALAAPSGVQLPYSQHKWRWGKYTINYATAGCGSPIVLVHGFGLSSSHYRKSIAELSKSYKVYAIDLLGFGASDKPLIQYTMEVWRDQLLAFCQEFCSGAPVTLVGNSIGSLACIMAAAEAPADTVRGLVLLNSAGAMNNKGILSDWRIIAAYPLLMLIDGLLSIPQVAERLFQNIRSKDTIKQALLNVYSNKDAVTDELVDLVYAPSNDRNARDVFVSVITGPPGPKPFGLVPKISAPMLILWGEEDTLTPADGPVGKWLQSLPATRPGTVFKFLPGVGHCLHDDKPELVHAQLLPWLAEVHGVKGACQEVTAAASPVSARSSQEETATVPGPTEALSAEGPAAVVVVAAETVAAAAEVVAGKAAPVAPATDTEA